MGTNAKTAHTPYAVTPSTAEPDASSSAPASQAGDLDLHAAVDDDLAPGQLPVTPIPATPDVGHAFGEPVLVGGEDLLASTATLVSYHSPAGPRSVLHARVSEEAEAKLLDALSISPAMAPVQVEQVVQGRLPVDEKHSLADKIITAAKSINHHLKDGSLTLGTALPTSTAKKISEAHAALKGAEADIGEAPSPDEAAMLHHYEEKLEAVDGAAANAVAVSHVAPFLHEGTAIVTVMKPVLPPEATSSHAVAILRDATRIKPKLDTETGEASWDGHARSNNVTGKEYAIDLGDGFHAVYRPYGINNPATTEYSLRGRLEVIAPAGEGHGPALVARLGRLHLANRPMTRDEGEYTYLTANVAAQDLTGHAGIAKAQTTGEQLEEMVRQEIFHERAHQAVGMSGAQLTRFAKDIQLEAHTRALPAKVQVLRDAVAEATGFTDGTALAASIGYDPAPRRSAGWLTWTRFDVGNSAQQLTDVTKGRALVHKTSGTGLKAMLSTGVLASTERRTTMGAHQGVGKSEDVDKLTGGASSVFLRMAAKPAGHDGPLLVWDQPERLLNRADYYGANGDTFGVVNPAKMSQYGNAKATRNPFKIATFHDPSNEVMFTDGIDLLGHEGPSRILCATTTQRDEIHAMLAAKGISHIAGKPIDQVVAL